MKDIDVEISVELGSTELTFRELKKLNNSGTVELDQNEGDPVTIKANGSVIGEGELVIIDNEQYGVRITKLKDNLKQ